MLGVFIFTAFLCVIRAQGDWEPCGVPSGCYCSVPLLHQIYCQNITVFPFFETQEKPGVLSVSIRDTQLVGLPPFEKEQWDRLNYITFADNPLLSCSAIDDLRRPGLHILSDCNCSNHPNLPKKDCPKFEKKCHTCASATACLATLLLLIFTIVLALGFILYRLKKVPRFQTVAVN